MDITNLKFLFYGYSAAWIIITAFVLLLVRRGRRIDRELARLKSLVENREKLGVNMNRRNVLKSVAAAGLAGLVTPREQKAQQAVEKAVRGRLRRRSKTFR